MGTVVQDQIPQGAPLVGDLRFSQSKCSVNFSNEVRTIFDTYDQVIKAIVKILLPSLHGNGITELTDADGDHVTQFLARDEYRYLRLDRIVLYQGNAGKTYNGTNVRPNCYYSNNNRRLVVLKMIQTALNVNFRVPMNGQIRSAWHVEDFEE